MEIQENRNTLTATYDPAEWDTLRPEVLNLKAAARLFDDRAHFKGDLMRTLLSHCPDFETDDHNTPVLSALYSWAIGDTSGRLDPLKGIWLYGDEGCGKSTVANALISFMKSVRSANRLLSDGRMECFPYNDRRICTFTSYDAIDALHTKSDARFDCTFSDVMLIDDLTAESTTVTFAEMNVGILPWLLRKRCDMLRSGGFVRPTVVTCGLMPETLAALLPNLFGKLCRTFNFVKLEGPMRGNIDPVFHLTR